VAPHHLAAAEVADPFLRVVAGGEHAPLRTPTKPSVRPGQKPVVKSSAVRPGESKPTSGGGRPVYRIVLGVGDVGPPRGFATRMERTTPTAYCSILVIAGSAQE
jgi:hypothetical protein